jgi:hypothetical protein
VAEAADRLGITKEAVRKRISRRTLRSEKDPDGTVRVYVPPSTTESATASIAASEARDELVEALREEIAHLRRESERKDAILMSLSQANAEQARTIREIEAPQEHAEAPETVEEEPEGARSRSTTPGAQESAERPWWRRMFGG